jgi:hypothetical protein
LLKLRMDLISRINKMGIWKFVFFRLVGKYFDQKNNLKSRYTLKNKAKKRLFNQMNSLAYCVEKIIFQKLHLRQKHVSDGFYQKRLK